MSDGVDRIAAERQRQISEEGHSAEHDAVHRDSSLAYAAACYAAPEAIYMVRAQDGVVRWEEPWPRGWRRRLWPHSNSTETRLSDLTKAGALIAAEIDRIVAAKSWHPRETHRLRPTTRATTEPTT